MKRLLIAVGVVLLVSTVVVVSFAEPLAFSLDWWTVDGGGGTSGGGGYTVSGTIGQPDAGEMSGDGYVLQGGFWQACAAPAAANVAIVNAAGTVQLSWTAVADATEYHIYRAGNDPYFTPATIYATTGASPWSDPDTNSIGDVATNYTYVMRAANSCGEGADSGRVGEFDFSITPGT